MVDGLHNYDNSLQITLLKCQCIAKTFIEVFSIWFLEKGDDHCHLHIGFVIGFIFLRLIYSIESTAVIPVNLKIGYESTVLSRCSQRRNPVKTGHWIRRELELVVGLVVSHGELKSFWTVTEASCRLDRLVSILSKIQGMQTARLHVTL